MLEETISKHLAMVFGFPVPVLVREKEVIFNLVNNNPFKHVEITKDTRLYISFLKEKPTIDFIIPWTSDDGSYRILEIRDRTIVSVLNLSVTQTTKGMETLEHHFGKNITTRNWNTIVSIADKIKTI